MIVILYLSFSVCTSAFLCIFCSLRTTLLHIDRSLLGDAKQKREDVQLQNGNDDLLGGYPP